MHLKSVSYFSHLASKPLCTITVFFYISCIQEQIRKWLPSCLRCLSLRLPETNILFVCLVCGVVCMNTVLHIPATPPSLPYPILIFSS